MRSNTRDGLANRLELHLTTSFPEAWELVQSIPPLRRRLNRTLITRAILKMPTRPNPLTTKKPYIAWDSLTDRSFANRHLPPVDGGGLPPVEEVRELFRRPGRTRECPKSTVLFPYFAQWFTDGFLRSDRAEPPDPRKTESNHEIDLTPLYGVRPHQTAQLRAGEGGRLKSQLINGEEFPPHLCADGEIKPEFDSLGVVRFDQLSFEQRSRLFAMGSDTSNFQLGFVMLNVLFLREHNRIAGLLARQSPDWDDERLFSTARNILTVVLIKIVVEEYINHIAPYHFKFSAEPWPFRKERWYRTNWMAIEFNLLYRWHSLVPSTLRVHGRDLGIQETLFDNELVTRRGIGPVFEEASRQPAAQVGLFNTDPWLLPVEEASIQRGRAVSLAPYNDYRALCSFPRVTRFDQISGSPEVQNGLRDVYGSVDRVEFYVGLFAEDPRPNSVLPSLMGRMVGIDAFSQALTNPLLAPRVYGEQTFTELGMDIIATTHTLSDLLHRNLAAGSPRYEVRMTRSDWQRA